MKMKAKNINLSRGLPKTGQTTEYRAGDDGTYQAGWWRGKNVANNKTRFVIKTIDGDVVVIDRATGLMWAADGNEAGCNGGVGLIWNAAIDYANALNFAGFTDWRLPDIDKLISIVDFGTLAPTIDEIYFTNTKTDYYWSSTTILSTPTSKYTVDFGSGISDSSAMGFPVALRCVRGGV